MYGTTAAVRLGGSDRVSTISEEATLHVSDAGEGRAIWTAMVVWVWRAGLFAVVIVLLGSEVRDASERW